jgi:hypothetical protein
MVWVSCELSGIPIGWYRVRNDSNLPKVWEIIGVDKSEQVFRMTFVNPTIS